ncbi:MAG: hydrolase [Ruminococcaceae bacterium]|nr:hydrolase [Oscillospiraceae bacterium]
MNNKTLYVSDLDGTLLRCDQTLSDYTAKTINSLVQKGIIFSYATARSFVTSKVLAKNITTNIPVIVHNGTFIIENVTGKILYGNYFSLKETKYIYELLSQNGIYPMTHSYMDGIEKLSFCPELITDEVREFLSTRSGDERLRPVEASRLCDGDMFHFSCIGEGKKLKKMYDVLKDSFHCVYYLDIYSGDPWLEIYSKSSGKGNAILELKKILGCDRVVCFGDAVNDIPMFKICDEAYAVENADYELKKIATGVIEGNNCDGVAKWLTKNV